MAAWTSRCTRIGPSGGWTTARPGLLDGLAPGGGGRLLAGFDVAARLHPAADPAMQVQDRPPAAHHHRRGGDVHRVGRCVARVGEARQLLEEPRLGGRLAGVGGGVVEDAPAEGTGGTPVGADGGIRVHVGILTTPRRRTDPERGGRLHGRATRPSTTVKARPATMTRSPRTVTVSRPPRAESWAAPRVGAPQSVGPVGPEQTLGRTGDRVLVDPHGRSEDPQHVVGPRHRRRR